jgi:serine/threonine-protein kinase
MTEGFCPHCGAPIGPGALFCMKCGADISGQQQGMATRMVKPRGTSPVATTARISQADLLARLRDATLGEYEILAELGHGGMATVYLAHDLHLDRKVAIKVLNPRVAQGEGMVERFRLEARTAAGLSHPHIIPIHAVRETNALVFIVMKFVVGRPLDAIIKESGPLPIPTVRTILTKVADALGYAHRNGVIHRDIKPANIMIDSEGMPIVADFGIAKVADRQGLTLTGAALGTPTYMSPEQCNADALTGASDQYSLGVVAYEMLTGRPLYEGESVVTVMFRHVHEAPPSPEALGPAVPLDLARAVVRMLQKSPERRWPNMEMLLPVLRGADATHEDSVRTQLIELARKGTHAELLARISTPRSPIASVRARGPAADAPTRVVAASKRRSRMIPIAATILLLGGGASLAVLRPWRDRTTSTPQDSALASTPAAAAVDSPAALPPAAVRAPEPTREEPARAESLRPEPPAPAPVQTVRIQDAPPSLPDGQSAVLRAVVLDQTGRAMSRTVRWSSSDPEVVAVRAGGQISGVSPGRATITAEADGRRAEARITVTPVVARVSVSPTAGDLRPGGSLVLTATAVDRHGVTLDGQAVSWRSSDERVAVVSSVGRVTAVGAGTAVISALVAGQVGSAEVSVAAPAAVPPPAEPPPPVIEEDPRQAITEVVRAYADALQAKDLGRVRALYPGMTPAVERSTRNALDAMEDLRVRLAPTRITVSGRTAEAVVTGEWTHRGGRLPPVTNRYSLERRTGGWVIVHIE